MIANWKPISDKAKKKGPVVLTDGGYFVVGFWNMNKWMAGWNFGDAGMVHVYLEPTHWDNLPKGPKK